MRKIAIWEWWCGDEEQWIWEVNTWQMGMCAQNTLLVATPWKLLIIGYGIMLGMEAKQRQKYQGAKFFEKSCHARRWITMGCCIGNALFGALFLHQYSKMLSPNIVYSGIQFMLLISKDTNTNI